MYTESQKSKLKLLMVYYNCQKLCNKWRNNGVISGAIRDDLEEKERMILEELDNNPDYSGKELSEHLNIPYRSVQRYVSNLRENALLKGWGQIKAITGK